VLGALVGDCVGELVGNSVVGAAVVGELDGLGVGDGETQVKHFTGH
jgi:hypothetical protein